MKYKTLTKIIPIILFIYANNGRVCAADFFLGENSDCRIVIREACIAAGFSEDAIHAQPIYLKMFFERNNPDQAVVTIEDSRQSGFDCNQMPRGPAAPPAIIQLLIRGIGGINRLCLQYWAKKIEDGPLERKDLSCILYAFNEKSLSINSSGQWAGFMRIE
ncbi:MULTISPECIES: hypothetical protein [Methylococcus]|uniref:Lipoprotein n=1 Tax=Methylococcus capsulatus TaxID=414 RepID=A0ABZ2F4A7_METCP|nr:MULTISPECIES: hypothetical protein [Methylococcus]MDF9392540.1 hypothetical protein [Methylococcus capsulatus]